MNTTFQTLSRPLRRIVPADQMLPVETVAGISRAYLWLLRLLCGAALCITGYLAVVALNAGDVAGCDGGSFWSCGEVLHTRWSKLLGVPVSVPAFVLYAVLLIALAVCHPATPPSRRRLAWSAITVGSLAAGFAALWFIGLQTFAIGHLCAYCIAAHACGIALCIAVLVKRPLGTRITARLASLSVVGVGMLIGSQLMAAPPATFKVEHFADNDANNESDASSEETAPVPVASKSNDPKTKKDVEVFEPF